MLNLRLSILFFNELALAERIVSFLWLMLVSLGLFPPLDFEFVLGEVADLTAFAGAAFDIDVAVVDVAGEGVAVVVAVVVFADAAAFGTVIDVPFLDVAAVAVGSVAAFAVRVDDFVDSVVVVDVVVDDVVVDDVVVVEVDRFCVIVGVMFVLDGCLFGSGSSVARWMCILDMILVG